MTAMIGKSSSGPYGKGKRTARSADERTSVNGVPRDTAMGWPEIRKRYCLAGRVIISGTARDPLGGGNLLNPRHRPAAGPDHGQANNGT
jgi:hypothetical protein